MRKRKLFFMVILASVLTLSIAACKKNPPVPPVGDGEFSLSVSSLLLEQGDTYTITLQNNAAGAAARWSSSDETVVSVDGGTVTAKKAGAASVTAKIGEVEKSCLITVTADNIPLLIIDDEQPAVFIGGTYELPVYVSYNGVKVTDKLDFSVRSLNADIAAINSAGEVEGVSEGTAQIVISVSYRFYALEKTISIEVKDFVTVSLDKQSLPLLTMPYNDGIDSYTFVATAIDNGTVDEAAQIVYSLKADSGEGVLDLNTAFGKVTALKAGSATVVATYTSKGGKTVSAECTVTVTKTHVNTNLKIEYEKNTTLGLPEFTAGGAAAAADFTDANVLSVKAKADGTTISGSPVLSLDPAKIIAYNADQLWTVSTLKADYDISAYVWSKIIKTESELRSMRSAADIVTPPSPSDSTKTYKIYYGNFKLGNDLTLTQTWGENCNLADHSGNLLEGTNAGYQGTFDGNGKTINNLKIAHARWGFYSLFGHLGGGAVVKNFTLKNASIEANTETLSNRKNFIASYAYGGTVEEVRIEYTVPTDRDTLDNSYGALFGDIYDANTWKYSRIVLKNVTLIGDTSKGVNENFAAFGRISNTSAMPNPLFECQNVVVVGSAVYGDSRAASKGMVKTYEGVTVYDTIADYEAQ